MDANNMNATPVTPTPENSQAAENPVPVAPSPEPRKKSSGRFLFLLIGLIIGVCATAAIVLVLTKMKDGFGKTAKLEGDGYETPEEAVTAYAEYLQAGDFDGILSTFAMESFEENYSVEEFYDRIRAFSPGIATSGQQLVMLGNDSVLTSSVNLENRRAYISSSVFRQMIVPMAAQVDDEELASTLTSGITFIIDDDDDLETLMEFLNSDPKFENIEIGDFLDKSDFDFDFGKALKEYNKYKKKSWGGDIENICMELEIDGDDYILFMTCVCYDDKWYIAEFGNYFSLACGISPQAAGLCPEDVIEDCFK
ncbi:MAG: hypothetical protein J6P78_04445 [Lachnospiraceae bacterium]|nr:hypothetical protein [Lachnospiraceae bacterium]